MRLKMMRLNSFIKHATFTSDVHDLYNWFMVIRPRQHFCIEQGITSHSHLQDSFDMFDANQTPPLEAQLPLQFACVSYLCTSRRNILEA